MSHRVTLYLALDVEQFDNDMTAQDYIRDIGGILRQTNRSGDSWHFVEVGVYRSVDNLIKGEAEHQFVKSTKGLT